MASRYRSIARPALYVLKHATRRSASPLAPSSSSLISTSTRSVSVDLRALQTLLPLHSAVSTARLISRLGIDACGSASSRSLSQGMLRGSDPGV